MNASLHAVLDQRVEDERVHEQRYAQAQGSLSHETRGPLAVVGPGREIARYQEEETQNVGHVDRAEQREDERRGSVGPALLVRPESVGAVGNGQVPQEDQDDQQDA
jgi:hypothetical protein